MRNDVIVKTVTIYRGSWDCVIEVGTVQSYLSVKRGTSSCEQICKFAVQAVDELKPALVKKAGKAECGFYKAYSSWDKGFEKNASFTTAIGSN